MSIIILILVAAFFSVVIHELVQAIRFDGRCRQCGGHLQYGGYDNEKSWCPYCSQKGDAVDAAIGEVIRKREKQ